MALGSAIRQSFSDADPSGYYALLGVAPDASPADITAAYRRQARVLHPDIPVTGSLDRFLAVKQAYDLLSDPDRRTSYDRTARRTASQPREAPETHFPHPPTMVEPPMRRPRFSDMPTGVWIGLALLIILCAQQLVSRLSTVRPEPADTRPRSSTPVKVDQVAEASPIPRQPGILAGIPNHYTTPGPGPATMWRHESEGNRLIPIGRLEPFTPVQALRLFRSPGMMEIRLSETANGFVQATRLAQGNLTAARRAFCIFHAGPSPSGAGVLVQTTSGSATLIAKNRDASPAVIKLRDPTGHLVVAIYLPPGDEARLSGLPDAPVQADFAHGEVWSQGCGGFAVGQRAWRIPVLQPLASLTPLIIPPDPAVPNQAVELSDQAFLAD